MKGIRNRTAITRPGMMIAPQTSVPPGKNFKNSNRNRKYHSGRAAEYGSDPSAGAPNSGPNDACESNNRGLRIRNNTAASTAMQATPSFKTWSGQNAASGLRLGSLALRP